jgi:hypothetical protein
MAHSSILQIIRIPTCFPTERVVSEGGGGGGGGAPALAGLYIVGRGSPHPAVDDDPDAVDCHAALGDGRREDDAPPPPAAGAFPDGQVLQLGG